MDFLFERTVVHGADALRTWQRMRADLHGWPVIVGGDESLERIMEQQEILNDSTPAEIIARAAGLVHPASLAALRAEEQARMDDFFAALPPFGPSQRLTSEESLARFGVDLTQMVAPEPTVPVEPDPDSGDDLALVRDHRGKYLDRVHILTLPTRDPTEVPAWLHWGNWNSCPPPEHHVAALRSWRDRYGAELVGLGADVMEVQVSRCPATRRDALALAKEQYVYCPDIVDQGIGSVEALTDGLLTTPLWFFWWD